jgi:leucyl aminopeptidase
MSEEIKAVAKGGLWTDDNLDQPLDWQGETGSTLAAEGETTTHTPRTARQLEKEILSKANIDDEVLSIITSRIADRFKTAQFEAIALEFDKMTKSMEEHRATVEEWMNAQSQWRKESEEQHKNTESSGLRRLDEQVATIEDKIAELLRLVTSRGAEEVEMIHEAHKIIKDRQAVEESEISSEPSIIGRMQARVQSLNESLRTIEPHAIEAYERGKTTAVAKKAIVKKFGRL